MSRSTRDPAERAVAVIGVGAILPDAPDAPAFWQNVMQGRDSISEVRPDRWQAADYYDPDPKAPGKTYSKIGGWVRGVSFEPTKFRIPPTVSAAMDDGQKWALLCASEALRDAGHPDRPLDTESTAVILGNAMGGELHYLTCLRLFLPEYVHAIEDTGVFQSLPASERAALVEQLRESIGRRFPDSTEDTMPGELTNITSGRVAGVLNLRGPNFTTDAACASSLAALQSAVDGLIDHHYDVALTGAMDRNMGPTTFIKFCKIGALSGEGSRPYDKDANGFVMGEGGAFFVCKRLEDAEQAGDRIYAVVRGVGGSSDGKGKGITAPNPVGQILAIRRAWQRAGLDPATMTLLEGHGTSTRAGDVTEMETVAKLFAEGSPVKHRIALGSIKSQIGHLKSAAGAASLLKVVLACHHKVLPPSINFRQPNPDIAWDKMPLAVNTQAQPWEKPAFGPRRCGISAFGFGGTNFHVVIEEYVPGMLTRREPVVQVPASFTGGSPGPVGSQARGARPSMLGNMLAVGGSDTGAVRASLQQALARAKAGHTPDRTPPGPDFLAAPARLVIAFENAADLLKKGETALDALAKDEAKKWRVLQSKGIHFRRGPAAKVAFLFPGQGSQYVNMLADVPDPIVRETFAEADRVMGPILGQPLTGYVYKNEADPAAMQAAEEALKDTTICQPAMVASDIAVMRLLDKHGVQPDIVMGHSLGEWAAAVGAGMVTFPEALVAVSARARAMASVSIGDKGKMASVAGPTEEIARRLPEIGGYLTLANINSRKQTVIAGASDAVDRAVAYFNSLGMTAQLIPVSHAFHSKVVAPASDALYRTICEMQIAFPRIPLVGNIDGQLYPTDDIDTIRRRLADQMASSVQFVKGIETCYREGARIFVEIGPKRALTALAESILDDKGDIICLSTNHPKRGGVRSFHDAMCGFYAAGIPRPEQLLTAVHVAQPDTGLASAPCVAAPAALRPSSSSQGAIMSESPNRVSMGQPDYEGLGKLFARFLDEGMALYGGRRAEQPRLPDARQGSVVVSGAALGLPGQTRHVFDDSNADRILRGESFIDPVPQVFRARMVEKNIVRLHKREVGEPSLDPIRSVDEVIRLAARRGVFDIVEEFGVPRERAEAWDITSALAIAAGIEALRDAGIPLVRHYRRTTTGSYLPDRWRLPVAMADETGVIFASAFPGYDNLVDEVTRFFTQRNGRSSYEFDRRFLFRILAMGHSQFAELLGIRGPNTQVNAACASTTMAVGMAEDWIRAGRCRRVLVIGADDVTSDNLLEWMGAGFLATGAASTEEVLEKAALPFDRRRNGMLIGMGACGLVVESEDSLRERGMRGLCEVLGSEFANSAFHGTRLDVDHIEGVMERLVSGVERRHGLDRHQMARELVFISHETYTPARGGSASAEVFALRKIFGASANDLVVCNTKGFTGHPMGVGVEDAAAVRILERQIVPPVPNYREPDPELGTLNLSKGGHYPVRYALRLAAGFGSQIAMTVLRRIPGLEERVADQALYQHWLSEISGYPAPVLEVEKRTLRIKDNGAPAREPAQSSWTMGTGPMAELADAASALVAPPPPRVAAAPLPPSPAAPRAASVAAAPAPRPAAPPSPTPTVAPAQAGAAPVGDVVMEQVLKLVSDKTGYPRDMLEPDLDLEADLGIDTVKQAEVFALVRETFGIPRQDTLKLRDYPTLRHVVAFVKENRPELAGRAEAPCAAPANPPADLGTESAPSPAVSASPAPGATGNVVAERVLEIVAEKTGYPRDMLELDLDLEADLGIDTVKQAEVFALVRESFNIPRQDTLKLRDYPTLRHVIGFVEANRPDLVSVAGAAPGVATATPSGGFGTDSPPHLAPSALRSPVAATAETAPVTGAGNPVEEKVLELVAGKTGYPREMLELDLDLEADLGIDTVKQAEVFALVRESFGIPRQDDVKLRDYPTLRHVIGFVNKYSPAAAPAAPVGPAEVAPEAETPVAATQRPDAVSDGSPFVSGLLRRPVVTLRPPLASCKKTGVRLERGSRVVVVADSGDAGKLLCEELESRGVQVLRVDARPDRAELEAALRTWAQAGNVGGLYFLPALDGSAPLSDMDLVQFRKSYHDRVLLLHGAARGLYDVLGNPGTFFITATRMGGQHGYGAGGALNPVGGAVAGFTKTLRRERPTALAKAVDFQEGASADTIARALIDEAERDPGAVEIGYVDGLRVAVGLEVMQGAPADAKAPCKLDANTVFAVTGGAGAITVAIVRDLATASRGTFYLLDARAMPPESEHALLNLVVADREAAKRQVFERLKADKGRATPTQVEEKLFDLERQAGILEALRAVEQAGGRAFYRQVDVLDGGAVKAVVDDIRAQSGHLDVILHAAGLERSRSLDRKPVEEFDLVFRVKADGLFNLLAATREMDVKAVVGFSSVAGRFGNAGQADYAAGNDFMCKTLSWWAAGRPGSLGIALDWTAWGGIGMATRGSIPEIMKRAGIDMLAPAEGLPVIRRALEAGFSGEAVVGRRLGILLEPLDKDGGVEPDGSLQARAREKALPLPFDNVSFDLHSGMTAEIRLDPKLEPFLHDHAIDGIPVLPGVMGLETFAEAAWLLAPQCRVAVLENVRFLAPMKYYRHEPRSVIVRARPLLSADGRVRVHTTLSSIQVVVGREPEEKLHFAGVVVLEQGQGQAMRTTVDGAGPVGGIGHDDIYRVYFHGPAYQVLEMVNRLSSGQVVGTMRTPLPADTTKPNSISMVGPRMVELCFQTAGVWEIGQTGQMGLPSVVERVTVFDPAPDGKSLVAELQPRSSQDALSFDMRVRDSDGKVYLTVEGYRTSRLPGGLPDEALGRFRGVIG